MEGRRDSEFLALRPHRIVIVLAVEAEGVHPVSEARRFGPSLGGIWNRPARVARHHHRFESKLAHGKFKLGDRFGRRMHRDERGWREALFEAAKGLGLHLIERAG